MGVCVGHTGTSHDPLVLGRSPYTVHWQRAVSGHQPASSPIAFIDAELWPQALQEALTP